MNSGSYIGGKDVSRIKQSMNARKANITKKRDLKKTK